MGIFSLLETFFMISLVIMIVLVGLLLYHVRGRIDAIEKRVDNLFDISGEITKEVNASKVYMANMRVQNYVSQPPMTIHASSSESSVTKDASPPVLLQKESSVVVVSDDEDEGDDEGDDEDDADEGDESDSPEKVLQERARARATEICRHELEMDPVFLSAEGDSAEDAVNMFQTAMMQLLGGAASASVGSVGAQGGVFIQMVMCDESGEPQENDEIGVAVVEELDEEFVVEELPAEGDGEVDADVDATESPEPSDHKESEENEDADVETNHVHVPASSNPASSKYLKWNLSRLREYAASKGIVTTDKMKKADIIALL